MGRMSDIERRILRAVVKMVHERKWRPKVIYLSPADYAEWRKARWGRDLGEVDGIEIRISNNKRGLSRLYADHGYSGVTI